MAVLLAQSDELAKARDVFRDAIRHQRVAQKADPAKPVYRQALLDHYESLFLTLVKLGDHAALAAEAEEWAAVSPEDWRGHYRAAHLLGRCADLVKKDSRLSAAQAKTVTEKYEQRELARLWEAARRRPDKADAQCDLALFLATSPDPKYRDPRLAVELATKAVEADSRKGVYWGALGVAHYRAGNWQDAVRAIDKASTLRSGGDVLLFRAMAHWKLDEKDEARKWYEQGVQWIEKHAPKDEAMRRIRAEAEEILEMKKKK